MVRSILKIPDLSASGMAPVLPLYSQPVWTAGEKEPHTPQRSGSHPASCSYHAGPGSKAWASPLDPPTQRQEAVLDVFKPFQLLDTGSLNPALKHLKLQRNSFGTRFAFLTA
jgi:hypothetical protein